MSVIRSKTVLVLLGCALVLLAGIAALALARRPGDLEVRLARMRAAGYPMNPAELNAWYVTVPPDQNLAPGVLDAMMAFRHDAKDTNLPLIGRAPRIDPGLPLPPEQLAAAKSVLESNSGALSNLVLALKRPKSRYPVDLSRGYLSRLAPLSTVKQAGMALALVARLDAEEGRSREAVMALTNGLHLADTLGGEPVVISYLVSVAMRQVLLGTVEQILSRTTLSDADLQVLQDRLTVSTESTTCARGMAGEFANYSDLFTRSWSSVQAIAGGFSPGNSVQDTLAEHALHLYWMMGLKDRDRRVGVVFFEDTLSAARLPDDQQVVAIRKAEGDMERTVTTHFYPIARMLLPSLAKVAEKDLRCRCLLRAAATACAVERYRLAHHGERPESLDVLVPAYLPSVPRDPWTGRALIYRKLDPGYVIYGVGEDGKDDSGTPLWNRPKGGQGGWDDSFTVGR